MTRKPAERRILHVDMDAFFAAVELQRHPEWAGRPLVVGGHGDPNQRGVVSTASYEARRLGIRSGLPLRTAYRLCPEALFVPVDFAAYVPISERIKAVLREIAPQLEDAGIDEAYLDITGHIPSLPKPWAQPSRAASARRSASAVRWASRPTSCWPRSPPICTSPMA